MHRSLLLLLTLFIHTGCTKQKQPEIVICVEEGKIIERLINTERYKCNFDDRYPFQWVKYQIPDTDIIYIGDNLKKSYFLYSTSINKAYYYQGSNLFTDETTLFDSLYLFKKGSSIFLDQYISITLEPITESTLTFLLDGAKVTRVSSVSLFAEECKHSVLPYLEQLMIQKKLSEQFISNSIEILKTEIMTSLKDAAYVYVSQPQERLIIYVFKRSQLPGKSFVYYEFEI